MQVQQSASGAKHANTNRQAAITEARCPHGSLPGACAACRGGGGGGRTRQSGLMNWNEAYALWKSLQVGQVRQADYLQGLERQQQAAQQHLFSSELRLSLANQVARLIVGAQTVISQWIAIPQRLFSQIGAQLQQTIQTTLQHTANLLQRVVDIADKLATILGEAKKFLDDQLHHLLEEGKALLRRLQALAHLTQVTELAYKIMRQFFSGDILQTAYRSIQGALHKLGHQLRRWFQRSKKPASSDPQSI